MTKISIIIPTYNRPKYLRRVLDYYNSCKVIYNIVVDDSSSDENKRRNKETISSLPNLKVLYFGHYSSDIEPGDKFADALDRVDTKYCLSCGDDDFIVPSGIERSIDFLEKNKDFSIAQGQAAAFYPRIKEKGNRKFYWQIEYLFESNTLSDSKSRLVEQMTNYSVPTFYGVYRTDFLRMIFRETLRSVNHGRLRELLLAALTLTCGKMECWNGFYAAREIILDSAGIVNDRISDLIKRGEYDEEYAGFRKCLASHLKDSSDLALEESEKVVDDAMSVFLKNDCPGPRKQFLMDILGCLPGPISKKIQLAYRAMKLRFFKPKNDLLKFMEDPSSEYYADFIKIRDCIILHEK